MWLSALYIWGCLVVFSACDSCPEPEDAASWVKLKPQGHCEDEENFCPYRITLPPLSIQLPRPFRELEKMAKELQNLKEVVNRLRRDCQECKERQRGERGGWKDHGEEEERRTGQVVRIVTSSLPQDNTNMDGVKRLNQSSLERWSIDADQGTTDQNSEVSREIKIFDPSSLEETPEDIYEVKHAFSPITENFQPGELLESSIPKTKEFVPSASRVSEMSREVKIFNPSLEETPEDIFEVKPASEETQKEMKFQGGELLESSVLRTKDFPQQTATRNVKNISGILAVRKRVQNMTDTNGLSSRSGDANTRTIDPSISAGNRRIVNFSRAGGPLRPKTFINNRGAKVSDEDRLRNPAAVRSRPQAGDRTFNTGPVGTGFSPTSPHNPNPKPEANSRLTTSSEDKKMTVTNLKPRTNIRLSTLTEDDTIINPKSETNIRLTPSSEDRKMIITNQKPKTNSGITDDEIREIMNTKPGIKTGQITSTRDEKMTVTKPVTNTRLTLLTDDEKMKITNQKPGIKIGQTPSTDDDEKMTLVHLKLGTNSGLNPTSEDETMPIINPKLKTNTGLNPTAEKEKITITNPKPVTNTRLTLSTKDEKRTITNQKHGIKIGRTPSTDDEKMAIVNLNLETNSGLNPTTEDETMTIINPTHGTNNRPTLLTDIEKMTIINQKPGIKTGQIPTRKDETMTIINPKLKATTGLNPSAEIEKTTIINPKPSLTIGQTTSTEDEAMTVTNPKPVTNSRLTPSTHDKKMTNKEDTSRDFDPRTDYEINPKDARQVTTDGEENFRKLNKSEITKVPKNPQKEDQDDVSHTAQTNKSIFSVINRAEQPNLIKVENEHMGFNASSKADTSFSGKQLEKDEYLSPVKEKERSRDRVSDTERETNPLTQDYEDQTQSGTIIGAGNKEISHNLPSPGTVKKDMLSNRKTIQLESDMVNPTPVPSVKMTSSDRKVSIASKHEPPAVNQGTRRISIPSLISQPTKPKSAEDMGNIQSINSKKNISNVRLLKNITQVMPKLPIRPGRHPANVIPKLVVVPSNYSISGRNSNFGRRNGTVMMKPSYVRRRPNLQTEPNMSNQNNRGVRTNVSPVTQFINNTRETSTEHTEEIKDIPQATGTNTGMLDTQRLENTRSRSQTGTSQNVGDVQDLDTELNGTEGNSLQDKQRSGGKESKQFSWETRNTSNEHPMGVDKFNSKKNLLNPHNSEPTASTLNKELSSVNEKTQPKTSNSATSLTVTDDGESTKHSPTVTNTHVEKIKNISTPVSFENTVATRELELVKLNEDKAQKNSGDVLSNPNGVDNVRGNNAERYTVPVVLETLTNVEEIKGSKVFSLSPEDTADGFKTIAGDEVTQKDGAEIHSTCVSDCNITPSQQPTSHSRPLFDSDRGRGPPQDCADYITKTQKNGVYRVTPRSKNSTFHVFCDMETSGGGWTLIQHRINGNTSFNRTWDEYKKGFGKLMGEFWLGNDKIHWLTQAKNMSLRIELEDFEGIREYAQYDHFHVADESQQYRLSIGGYSGTAGDAMQFNKNYNHDQKLFTTPDRDNDLYPSGNCGDYYSSGWWFDACMSANLNGKYYHTKYKGLRNGIFWGTWHNITMEYYPTKERQSFKTVRMMIRPQNYAN